MCDRYPKYFMYDGLKHSCLKGNHIVNSLSFSKAYGMIAYPTEVEGLATELLEVQDNIPICASIISQHVDLHSSVVGPEWVLERVKDPVKNREIGEGAVQGGEGAIYLWATLPEKYVDDVKVVHWLANMHGVVVIPGTACGCPRHLRISSGGLIEDNRRAAAERLKRGLEELVKDGMVH
ncbi:hypothetical protein SCA6_019452 [Theobroma cacao]